MFIWFCLIWRLLPYEVIDTYEKLIYKQLSYSISKSISDNYHLLLIKWCAAAKITFNYMVSLQQSNMQKIERCISLLINSLTFAKIIFTYMVFLQVRNMQKMEMFV